MAPAPPRSVTALLIERARRHPRAKLVAWLGLAAGICGPYFALQHLPLGPPRPVPELGLDAVVAFQPVWVYAYLSLGALVPLAPLLAPDPAALRRYGVGLALLCAPCFVAFALYPVAGPRPPLRAEAPHLYTWLVAVDRPANSMPSLHAGLVLYSLLYTDRVTRGLLPRGALQLGRALGGAWGLAILYGTLATKQHWAIDLPAGMALAAVAHGLAWRGGDRR